MSPILFRHRLACALLTVSLGVPSLGAAVAADPATMPYVTPQGWTADQRKIWYQATQGSRLIPLDWLRALEQDKSAELFLAPQHIASLRYLADGDADLPLGFAVDASDDSDLSISKLRWKNDQGSGEKWVGMTCSACHTAQLTFQGKDVRIDGGPTLADFQTFIRQINAALVATQEDPDKFKRFADRVLSASHPAEDERLLKDALSKLSDWQTRLTALSNTDLAYGFGRLDAFGHIFNKVKLVAGGNNMSPTPADAPTSYPFLWNVPQHDRVQWNGIAENNKTVDGLADQPVSLGALGRNAGEVIGVFGDITIERNVGLGGYKSSANVKNLIALEQQLGALQPPAWPEDIFGKLKPALISEGRTLFAEHCQDCHQLISSTDLSKTFKVMLSPLKQPAPNAPFSIGKVPAGTDPWMACNAYTYSAAAGLFAGTRKGVFAGGYYSSAPAPLSDLLTTTVAGLLLGKKVDIASSMASSFFGINRPARITPSAAVPLPFPERQPTRPAEKEARLRKCLTDNVLVLAYKGRPLNGVWATAPFLHNGSVPTLYDLLLPAAERPTTFNLGSREFDPHNVGYVTKSSSENSFEFHVLDDQGKLIDGNWNTGHDYNNSQFNDSQRYALIEYLKTL